MSQALQSYSMPPMTPGAARVSPNLGPQLPSASPGGGGGGGGGGVGALAGLSTGAVGIDAALAFFGAQAQNKAISNAMARVRQQGATQVRQQQAQASEARRQRIRSQREAAGRLRVLRASGLGGSFRQRGINMGMDTSRDLNTISGNLGRATLATTQSVNNSLIDLNNDKRNPLLAGATAGLESAMAMAKAAAKAGAA